LDEEVSLKAILKENEGLQKDIAEVRRDWNKRPS